MCTFRGKLLVPLTLAVGALVLLLLALQGMRPGVSLAGTLQGDVSGNITINTTWTITDSPYTLTGEGVTVTAGAILTIEPGVVVLGQTTSQLRVQGRLVTLGTPTQPITFTSTADSDKNQWEGLVFDGGSGLLRHAAVRYAGRPNGIARANVAISGVLAGEVRIESSQVLSEGVGNVEDYGLYIHNSHVVVTGTMFSDNGDIQYARPDYALFATGDNTVITLTNNTFRDNVSYAARIGASQLHAVQMQGNVFADNGEDRVLIAGGLVTATATLTPQNGLEAYELDGDLIIPVGTTLIVQPGVVVMGQDNAELRVQGHMRALGTAAQPITFTRDIAGADSWQGLVFDGGTGQLRRVGVFFGGWSGSSAGVRGNVAVTGVLSGQVSIEDSQVLSETAATANGYGLYVRDSHVAISGTTFSGNDASDYVLYATGSSTVLTFTGNTFDGNDSYAARLEAGHLHRVHMVGNAFRDNSQDRIQIAGGQVTATAALFPQDGLEGYALDGDLIVPAGVTLTVEPGAVVMGGGGDELQVRGHLAALGTVSQPITFTSETDTGPSQWSGLVFDGGTGALRHATVRYGGGVGNSAGVRGNVVVSGVLGGQVSIESSQVLSESAATATDYGLYIRDSHVVVSGTAFSANGNTNADYVLYATGDSTTLTIANSVFQDDRGAAEGYGARVEAGHLHRVQMAGNTFNGSGRNRRVLIAGGALVASAVLTPQTALQGYVLGSNLTVSPGMMLSVAPGVTVMGRDATKLHVLGRLEALGTAARPITFTSEADTGPAGWSGLVFDGGAGELRHATVRYGGDPDGVLPAGEGSNISVRNVLTGQVRLESSQVLSQYYFSGLPGIDYGVFITNSHVVVSGTTFRGNGDNDSVDYALYAAGSGTALTITNSAFEENDGYAVGVLPENLHRLQMTANTFSGAGPSQRVLVAGGALTANAVLPPQAGLEGYVLADDLSVSTGVTLSVEPGVTVMGQGGSKLEVLGHLEALGTVTQLITFTSETNSGPNEWSGLVFEGGTGTLRHATVRYGGNRNGALPINNSGSNIAVRDVLNGELRLESSQVLSAYYRLGMGGPDYGIFITNSHVLIDDTAFRGHGDDDDTDYALYATGAGTVITVSGGSTFENNAGHGVYLEGGQAVLNCVSLLDNGGDEMHVAGSPVAVMVSGSVISDDHGSFYGLYNDAAITVTALYNWWGDGTGPAGNDTGGPGPIETAPWLSEPMCVLDLGVFKSGGPDPVFVQDPLVYTLTVINYSPSPATGVVVTDELPANLSFGWALPNQGSCVGTNESITCTLGAVAGRAAPGYEDVRVTVVVTPSVAAAGVVTNSASVTRQEHDPWTVNDIATVTTTVLPRADLAVVKSDAPDPVGLGDPLTYTLVVTNYGPSGATRVVLTDTLPDSTSYVSSSAGCDEELGRVVCNLAALDSDTGAQVTIVVTPALGGTMTNTATVTSTVFDRVTTNNTVSITTTVGTVDLFLAKTAAPERLRVGETLTYTLVVTNAGGPLVATHVRLEDALPLSVTDVFSTYSQGPGCDRVGRLVICDLDTLEVDASATVTLTVVTLDDGTITNTASVSSFEVDPQPDNNQASATTPVDPAADLVVAKQAWPQVVLGQPLTYTVVLTNNGPSLATQVELTDTLPLSVSLDGIAPGPGMNCDEAGGVITCDLAALAQDASVTAVVTVIPTATGTIENRVRVTGAEFDPDLANNLITATTMVLPVADLQVTKGGVPDRLGVGEVLTYTIAVVNHGPSPATAVVLTDDLPGEMNLVSYAPGCSGEAPVVCTLGALDSGELETVTIVVTPTAVGTPVNTVDVRSVELDPDLTDNRAQTRTIVGTADLSVAKFGAPDPVLVGQPLTFTLVISNGGPDVATGVWLTDVLPLKAGLVTASQGDCDGAGALTVTCDLGALARDDNVIVTIVVTPAVSGSLTNTVDIKGEQVDPSEENNTDTTHTQVDPAADLAVAKFGAPDPVTPGGTLTYTVVVTNYGPSTATGVRLTDTLPASVTYQLDTAGCDRVGRLVTCDLGDLSQNASVSVTIVVETLEELAEGMLSNVARVAGREADLDLSNNTDALDTTVEKGTREMYLPLVLKNP